MFLDNIKKEEIDESLQETRQIAEEKFMSLGLNHTNQHSKNQHIINEFFNNPPIDDEPWTEEDEKDWQNGMKEIAEGKIISWEEFQKEL